MSKILSSVSHGSLPSSLKYLTTHFKSSWFIARPYFLQNSGSSTSLISVKPSKIDTGLISAFSKSDRTDKSFSLASTALITYFLILSKSESVISSSRTMILPERILIFAFGLISLQQSIADEALWSNWPGKYSVAIYFLPFKSKVSETVSVTISPNT